MALKEALEGVGKSIKRKGKRIRKLTKAQRLKVMARLKGLTSSTRKGEPGGVAVGSGYDVDAESHGGRRPRRSMALAAKRLRLRRPF